MLKGTCSEMFICQKYMRKWLYLGKITPFGPPYWPWVYAAFWCGSYFFFFWLLSQHVSVNENMFHVTDWYHIVIQAKCKVRGIFQLTFWKGAIREIKRLAVISTIFTEKPLGWPFKGIIQLEIYYRAWKCKKIINLVTLCPLIECEILTRLSTPWLPIQNKYYARKKYQVEMLITMYYHALNWNNCCGCLVQW